MNVEAIAKKFGVKVLDLKPLRGVYLAYTDKGTKIIKKSKKEPEKLLYIHGLKEYIYQRGFHNLDRFLISKQGLPFVIEEQKIYIMEDFIFGRECSFSNPFDRSAAMRTLAELHIYGQGYIPPTGAAERNDIGKWEKNYLRKINDMVTIKQKVKMKKYKDVFDKMYLEDVDFFLEIAWRAYDTLRNSRYKILCKVAESIKPICHHDYTYHNIIIDKNYRINIIDFDYSCHELPCYDIAAVIQRVMRRFSFNIDIALEMIMDYDRVKPITDDEIILILSLFEFPQRFWRITDRYYSGKTQWSREKFIKKYYEVVDDKEFMLDFIDDFRRIVT
ncbi:MAG: CotS family spore coat protein [Clostridiales bacterium]|nr:CotS family spore coat protein [Clostridiales bacterium]